MLVLPAARTQKQASCHGRDFSNLFLTLAAQHHQTLIIIGLIKTQDGIVGIKKMACCDVVLVASLGVLQLTIGSLSMAATVVHSFLQ